MIIVLVVVGAATLVWVAVTRLVTDRRRSVPSAEPTGRHGPTGDAYPPGSRPAGPDAESMIGDQSASPARPSGEVPGPPDGGSG